MTAPALMRAAAICGPLWFASVGVRADDFVVYSPHVLGRLSEIEVRGYQYDDPRRDFSGGEAAEVSVSHAFADWWKPEVYLARYERQPGGPARLLGFEFENTLQLTQPGERWADFGLLASYEHQIVAGKPDVLEFGPLFERAAGRFTHRVNLIWEIPVGSTAGKTVFRYSYSGTFTISRALRPGIEAYGRPDDHAYQAGPILAGERHIRGSTAGLEYRIGIVLGINSAAPRRTWLAQLAYEFL